MFIAELQLHDYRSYHNVAVSMGPGVCAFIGANAQGKTNLLEALQYLAVGASHRVSNDGALVRQGAEAAVIRTIVGLDGGRRRQAVEYELRPKGRNRGQVDGQRHPRARAAIGVVRAVLFAPEDVLLVRGDPGERRRFLDELLGQRRHAYHAARSDYERILRQRNTLLRTARRRWHPNASGGGHPNASGGGHPSAPGESGGGGTLSTWTEALVAAGATLLAARIAAVHALAGPTAAAYRDLVPRDDDTGASGEVSLVYELSTGRRVVGTPGAGVPDPSELAAELAAGLADLAETEVERGLTLAGPHRDELYLGLGSLPARGYASQGEIWSLALALRLGSFEVLASVGEEPVVLLDDVFAELDAARRERLAARCADFEQVLVTAAVDADVPLDGPRYRVSRATVVGPDKPVEGGASIVDPAVTTGGA